MTDKIVGASSTTAKAAEVDGPIRVEYLPLSELVRAPRNPKSHDIGLIHQSLGRFGYVEPIALNERTGRIVAGHGRLETLQQKKATGERAPARVIERQGEWFVPVLRGVEFASDADAEAYLLASNQTTIAGGWDEGDLAKMLADLSKRDEGLEGTGFDQGDVDELLRRIGDENAAVVQDDEEDALERADELRKKWQTGANQIWEAGDDRLYCGDCRAVPEAFFAGRRIRLTWTDPPYGVNYAQKAQDLNRYKGKKSTIEKEIENDKLDGPGVRALFAAALKIAAAHAERGCALYATVPSGDRFPFFIAGMGDAGFTYKHTLVWVKNHFVIGMSDYHYRHEGVIYGWLENGAHRWCGGRDQDSVFEVDKPQVSELHPTTKPVELVARMIINSSQPGDIVYDPFCGSGTTLVAAHQLKRIGYGVELDAGYAAVALERLSNLGVEPRRVE